MKCSRYSDFDGFQWPQLKQIVKPKMKVKNAVHWLNELAETLEILKHMAKSVCDQFYLRLRQSFQLWFDSKLAGLAEPIPSQINFVHSI